MATFIVAITTLSLTSCVIDDSMEQTNTKSNQDPEGTTVINLRNDRLINRYGDYYYQGVNIRIPYSYKYVDINNIETEKESEYGFDLYMNQSNNFTISYATAIASIGAVSGLSGVNLIPSEGWSREVAVVPGNGYVVKIEWNQPLVLYYDSKNNRYDNVEYHARIYVVDYLEDTTGGIIGAVIKYQCPWTPNKK